MRSKILLLGIFLFILFHNFNSLAQKYSQQQQDSILKSYITVPETDLSIVPPAFFKGFIKDGKFGLIHEGAASSISFEIIIGVPYTMVIANMNAEYFKKQNIELIAQETVKTAENKDACLFLVGFDVKSKDGKQDVKYERLMLFTGTYNRTIWINANYPSVVRKVLLATLRHSLLSIKYSNNE